MDDATDIKDAKCTWTMLHTYWQKSSYEPIFVSSIEQVIL